MVGIYRGVKFNGAMLRYGSMWSTRYVSSTRHSRNHPKDEENVNKAAWPAIMNVWTITFFILFETESLYLKV